MSGERCLVVSCSRRQPPEGAPKTWRTPWWENYGTCSAGHAQSYYGDDVVTVEEVDAMRRQAPRKRDVRCDEVSGTHRAHDWTDDEFPDQVMRCPGERTVDFGDLLIALASDLDAIRLCVGCGADSTWAGIYVDEHALVSVVAWCDAASCEHDRVVASAGHVFALQIDHLPELRRG